MARLQEQLDRLAEMTPAELRDEWRRVYRADPPRLSPDLLRHGIAYRLQEKALGGLPGAVSRQLKRIATGIVPSGRLMPGTQLVRTWNGKTVSVRVTEDGFEFGDQTFRSLSAIAREVTGVAYTPQNDLVVHTRTPMAVWLLGKAGGPRTQQQILLSSAQVKSTG